MTSIQGEGKRVQFPQEREVNNVDIFVFTHAGSHKVKAVKALIDKLILPARPLQRRTPRPEQSIWAPVSICN